jgi:hypothetical protein
MKRRSALINFAHGCLVLASSLVASSSRAQRASNPIYRPGGPGGPLGPGRLPGDSDGANHAQLPGVYLVRAVNDRDDTIQVSDDQGQTAAVHVRPDVFDISKLKPGDHVTLDLIMPHGKGSRLEAASLWIP